MQSETRLVLVAWMRQFGAAMAVYIAALAAAIWSLTSMPAGPLRAAAVAAIGVAGLSLVYFFFELLGFPRLSAAWISNLALAIFVAQMLRLLASGA
jgi:hypothetical protein